MQIVGEVCAGAKAWQPDSLMIRVLGKVDTHTFMDWAQHDGCDIQPPLQNTCSLIPPWCEMEFDAMSPKVEEQIPVSQLTVETHAFKIHL